MNRAAFQIVSLLIVAAVLCGCAGESRRPIHEEGKAETTIQPGKADPNKAPPGLPANAKMRNN